MPAQLTQTQFEAALAAIVLALTERDQTENAEPNSEAMNVPAD